MKDHFGHGSNPGRGGGSFGRNGLQVAIGANFDRTRQSVSQEEQARQRKAADDRANTVNRLRGQFRDAGSGHANVLMRGLKHFLGS